MAIAALLHRVHAMRCGIARTFQVADVGHVGQGQDLPRLAIAGFNRRQRFADMFVGGKR